MSKSRRLAYRGISLDALVENERAIRQNTRHFHTEENNNKVPNVWHTEQYGEQRTKEQYSTHTRFSYNADKYDAEWPTVGQSMTKTVCKNFGKNKVWGKSQQQQQQKQLKHHHNQYQQRHHQQQTRLDLTNYSQRSSDQPEDIKICLYKQKRLRKAEEEQPELLQVERTKESHKTEHVGIRCNSTCTEDDMTQVCMSRPIPKPRQVRSSDQPEDIKICLYKQKRLRKAEEEQPELLQVERTKESHKTEHVGIRCNSTCTEDDMTQVCMSRPIPKPRQVRSSDKSEDTKISLYKQTRLRKAEEAQSDLLQVEGNKESPKTEHVGIKCNSTCAEDDMTQVCMSRPIPKPRQVRSTMELNTSSLSSYEKNPISAFMEYGQARRLTAKLIPTHRDGPDNEPTFTIAAVLNDREICRVNSSRIKDGRAAAADKALRILNSPANQEFHSRSICLESAEREEPSLLPAGRDPVSVLMEYAQAYGKSVSFEKIDQFGPPHQPTFTMVAKLGNNVFEKVQGGQLKQLKKKAALKALEVIDRKTSYFSRQFGSQTNSLACSGTDESFGDVSPIGKNPVSMLMEYAQENKISVNFREVQVEGPPHMKKFTYVAVLGDEEFSEQTGTTKKEAKRTAAVAALRCLKKRRLYHIGDTLSSSSSNHKVACKTFEDKIAALCQNKFDELVANVPDDLRGRKVVAAIVSIDEVSKEIQVVSIGSGNRCITGDKLSMKGNVITDSHAEIIAKRGFRRYLYNNIWSLLQGREKTVMEISKNGKYRIKEGITYHLYISTAPCGDGAVFSHSEQNTTESVASGGQHILIKDNEKQGQLRTKLEKGEGTIPIDIEVQSLDGIKRGDRLRTMSCSDKICSWNVLGLQGALLSNLIEPVYLRSITLGQLFSHGHLCRAVCCRVDEECGNFDDNLPEHYSVNHPKLGQVTAYSPARNTEKSRAYSINWNITDTGVEVTDGTTGLLVQSLQDASYRSSCIPGTGSEEIDINELCSRKPSSRLSKESLYKCYKSICRKTVPSVPIGGNYRESKRTAKDYQLAKFLLETRFLVNGCGNWLTKPEELDLFI